MFQLATTGTSSLGLGWVPRSVEVRVPGERCSSISNPLLVCGQHQKNSQDTGSVCEELDWKTGKGWQF